MNVTRSTYYDYTLSTTAGRVRKARIDLNMTIKEVSQAINISERNISDIENNKQNPTIVTLRKLADALKVPVSYLGCFEKLPEETLGQKIKKARLYHGLTKVEFSNLLSINEKTLRHWEKDAFKPYQKHLDKLSRYLKILNSFHGEQYE